MTVELFAEQAGSDRSMPLVLLHAFPLSSAMWSAQRRALDADGLVVTPDLRGFGRSPRGPDAPSLDVMADDVAALLDRLGLDRVVLGGLSMGGYVAMAFLRRHAGRVSALVLADTKAGADPAPAREKRERIAARLQAERSTDALVEEVLPTLLGPTTVRDRSDVVARVGELVRAADPDAAAWAQRAMAARPESYDTLRAADVPALVVRGAEDELSPAQDVEAMVTALPQGRLVELPGAGHLSAVEDAPAFTAALHAFLASLPTPRG